MILTHGGVDKYLFTSTDVIEVEKHTLTYTNYDKAILRQYEGAIMPSYKYSIFHRKSGFLPITICLRFVTQCIKWN